MTEITKTCKVAFMKVKDSFVIRCREERVNWKKNRMVKIYFSKLPANTFVHGSTKLFMEGPLPNRLLDKVMICLLTVD